MNWSAWAVEVGEGEAREAHVLVSAEASGEEVRAPVMVNLLLDRSGSMKGAPLAAAIEAAQQFVELARADDFLGLLLFDGVAEQRVAVMAMDSRGKRAMTDALADVRTGRGTALHQAVELGARSLQRVLVPGRRPKLLLLTDGEPSVGPDTQEAFDSLGLRVSQEGVSVHALGLARHYVAEVLQALTLPSGNAYEHVDGPDGLGEAMGAVISHLFGEVAHGATVRVQPQGFSALSTRHAYPTRAEDDALVVTLGDVSRGLARRVLLSGGVSGEWTAVVHGSWTERGDTRHQKVALERVAADSARGRLILSLAYELQLVAEETAAWLSLARRDLDRAEQQLELAESHLRHIVSLAPEGLPVRRHLERLGDLRLAVERGEGDIPLLIRRAQSAHAGTHVSQVIPLAAYRGRK
ncbi:MAG: Von Willebrand factor type domain protein [Myxococcaceae bacterium]|nr:Von Willebrand factor type domain protein [Myxococcaceae bacterium]